MKKILLASGIVLLLAACGDSDVDEEPLDGDSTDEAETSEDEGAAESGSPENAQDVIEEATVRHGEVISYEIVMQTTMTIDEETTNSTSSTMLDEDQNLQLEFTDSDGNVVSHYYLEDGNSFTYRNGEFSDLDVEITNENATYGDLLGELEQFNDAELIESTDGYTIGLEISSIDNLSPFLDEAELELFRERADDVSGEVEVYFNSDFVYIGASLDLTIESSESDVSVQSDVEILNIGNIDFIVLPEGAPNDAPVDEGASEGNDEVTEEEAEENIDTFEDSEEDESTENND